MVYTRPAAAGFEHFREVGGVDGAGLLAQHMPARGGGADDPFFANAGRQRNVNRVHVPGREQFLVTVRHAGGRGEWNFGLAGGDETARARWVAAGDGGEDAVAGMADGSPVFPGDVGGAEDAPAKQRLVHSIDSVD